MIITGHSSRHTHTWHTWSCTRPFVCFGFYSVIRVLICDFCCWSSNRQDEASFCKHQQLHVFLAALEKPPVSAVNSLCLWFLQFWRNSPEKKCSQWRLWIIRNKGRTVSGKRCCLLSRVCFLFLLFISNVYGTNWLYLYHLDHAEGRNCRDILKKVWN